MESSERWLIVAVRHHLIVHFIDQAQHLVVCELLLNELLVQSLIRGRCPNPYSIARGIVSTRASEVIAADANAQLILHSESRKLSDSLGSLKDRRSVIVIPVVLGIV